MWELVGLGCLILLITGIAVLAMRKTGQSEFVSFSKSYELDIDILASKLAKAIGKEFREALREELKYLREIGNRPYLSQENQIEAIAMDESLIPTKVDTNVDLANLENMAKEQVTVDKDISKSKSKLAGILKGKK
jgi:hypothetical protein